MTLEKIYIWNEDYYINQFESVSYICIYISIFINIDNFINLNSSYNKISFFKNATKQLMYVIINIIIKYALDINYFNSGKKKKNFKFTKLIFVKNFAISTEMV